MALEARQIDRRTATDLESVESFVHNAEDLLFASRVRVLGNRVHLAVVADRLDVADQSAGELVGLAGRRLRQLGGES